ncbi:MAG: hypothetical protein MJE68_26470, partial [Proteobacteria bacterium]|nr:hypothetical protein [Pseudomonadota bacterium]
MDTATITQQHDIVALHGTFHQGDESQFQEDTRGRQCVANSIASILLSKIRTIRRWTTEDLDYILYAGDAFYRKVRPAEYFDENPTDSGLLEIEDIPTECSLFNRHFNISQDISENCVINATEISQSLHIICQQAEKCDGIILMGDRHGAYASSLIYRNGKVYTFDPHSLSSTTGMPCTNDTCVLLTFDNIHKFAEYLVQCASVRHAEQLTFSKLIVTRMQQDQCGDPNFKTERHLNANSKSHTRKHESQVINRTARDDNMKNSTITKCSQDTESERKVTLVCDVCSETLDSLYNLNLHKEKCKEKQTFNCRICSKKLDNSHNL